MIAGRSERRRATDLYPASDPGTQRRRRAEHRAGPGETWPL